MKFRILIPAALLLASLAPNAYASEITGTLSAGSGSSVTGTVIGIPTATPPAGTYASAQSVTLSDPGAFSIRYTTDGSTPELCGRRPLVHRTDHCCIVTYDTSGWMLPQRRELDGRIISLCHLALERIALRHSDYFFRRLAYGHRHDVIRRIALGDRHVFSGRLAYRHRNRSRIKRRWWRRRDE